MKSLRLWCTRVPWKSCGQMLGLLAAVLSMALLQASVAVGQATEKVVHPFGNPPDGNSPNAGPLIFDSVGNLYGTTGSGGAYFYGGGTVFELTPNQDGSWAESVLYTFTDYPDGAFPWSGVVFDAVGNLYGTTAGGGSAYGYNGDGTVFKLSPNDNGGWTESIIHRFTGPDGDFPAVAGVVVDGVGNLYGTTRGGGAYFSGTVYKLSPNQDGSWTETVLYDFGGDGGALPYGGVILDAAGNLYGTLYKGGKFNMGTVYELSPAPGGHWTGRLLHTFSGGWDGGQPVGSLALDSVGNLYGVTVSGGVYGHNEDGEVFVLSPNQQGRYDLKVVHGFHGSPIFPNGNLVFDSAGDIYGTTQYGPAGNGGVFKLSPDGSGGATFAWFSLAKKDGYQPQGGVILDPERNAYGMALHGGLDGDCCGTVFEVSP